MKKLRQKQIKSLCVLGCVLIVGLLSSANSAFAAGAKKDWTMLVFINGHNNLDDFGAMNINQMEKVGSTDHLNVVVQWASLAASSTKRLLINKDNDENRVTSPVVQELAPVDMGDKKSLLEFIRWGAATYPADHYMVVVWNHGSGWHLKMRSGFQTRDISYDEKSGHHITTEELAVVMQQASQELGQKIDIYGSDACLMSMVEVAYEMYGAVNTFVGSEQVEPGDGWPYDRFLSKWTANPSADSNTVGKYLTEAYKDYYSDQQNDDTTFSAIDMRELPTLLTNIADLKKRLMSVTDIASVKNASEQSVRFYYNDYVDLGDMIVNVKSALNKTGEAQAELEKVASQLSRVVVANGVTGAGKAQGLAIWWPTDSYDWKKYGSRYQGLRFDKETKWSEALKAMYHF